jgi:primosomal protein N'
MRALTELADGMAGAPGDLLGPAALFRLRGKHRAQLVVKTERPREVASRAGRLLASAAKAMRAADLSVVVDVDPQSL